MKCQQCDREAVSKGFCRTHYRNHQIRERENALKDIINEADKVKASKPQYAEAIDAIKSLMNARGLFREFQDKKLSPAERIRALEKELEEQKRNQKKYVEEMEQLKGRFSAPPKSRSK